MDIVIESFPIGSLACNCSLIYSEKSREALVIDPGDDANAILKIIEKKALKVQKLIHTHAHFDHIGAARLVKEKLNALILLHQDDQTLYDMLPIQGQRFRVPVDIPGKVDLYLEDQMEMGFGASHFLKTLHTPGHTQGSCCFYTEIQGSPLLFSGDTLFQESIGRTDLWGGDSLQILKSIKQKLFLLPLETQVIPGHGEYTTLWHEKKNNSFL
jgi:glyoxylase-like metal-dependent hydrolase (beta-lactamase superfamily II)